VTGRRPALSVVVAATDGPDAVARTLASLEPRAAGPAEVIVVASGMTFPSPGPGRLILAPAGTGAPRLRRIGLEAATGRVVAFTEDSCLVEPGWADAWASAFADRRLVAASGLVEQDAEVSAVDRAVFLCEYAPFLPPAAAGPPARLAGNNFAVLREVALRESPGEIHETVLLAAIRRGSGETRTIGDAVVRQARRFGLREAIGDRLRFGLEFGRLRSGWGGGRLAGLAAGPAIFAAQVGRLSGLALRDRRLRTRPATTLPLTLGLLAAWSLGEWAGWVLGSPGSDRSAARRRRGTTGRTPARTPGRSGSPVAGCRGRPPVA